ncbi:MAG: nitroreductase, partial [Paludibacteraceae bacterium]|nr:nitroreductase [Paludibacteraceae bacterium]
MTLEEAIKNRHAVRAFKKEPIDQTIVRALEKEADTCCRESGLHLQLVT